VTLYFPRFGRTADELCVTELASVIWAVQMSTVEFHPWNSRRADVESPDEWRIDLDPMPDCGLDRVRRVAGVAREVLDEIGAVGWPKTSGGNGLHIYVRIPPQWGFGDVRRAALAFAREVERRVPDDATTTWWRKDRDPRKVFVDYNQNARDHTIASAYSVRGVREATVSTPITWDELGDLHAGIDDAVFSLDPLLEWADRDGREGAGDPGGETDA
jgi:DNA ligase D-like protein (predicted polymerase)